MKRAIRIIAAALICAVLAPGLFGCTEKTDFGDEVYKNKKYAGESIFFNISSQLLLSGYMSKPDNIYPACIDPFCDHSTESCAARTESPITATLTVLPEGRKLPLVYLCCQRRPTTVVDGEEVLLSVHEREMSIVKQFDAETGQAKTFEPVELMNIRSALLYRGILYLSADGFLGEGYRGRVGALDVLTGKCTYLSEENGARLIGAYDGRIYVMTGRGVVESCEPDFSDLCAVYDCQTGGYVNSYVDEGMLYFARSKTDVPAGDSTKTVFEVCAVDLKDKDAEAVTVASGVHMFMPYDGDLYYTLFDYNEHGTVSVSGYGEETVVSYDNGTLYRYDAEKGTSETCFSDIGASFSDIYDIDDGMILFSGARYRDYDEDKSPYLRIAICSIETGEWRELFLDDEEEYL